MAHGKRRDPEIIVRQDSTLPPQSSLETGVGHRGFVVEWKNERCLKTFREVGSSPLSPISPEGAVEQFTDRDE